MPKNKNQIERYQTINHLLNLRKGAGVHISELIDRCNTSDRTVKRDIQTLREKYNAPIEYDEQKNGYVYSIPFDIPLDLVLSHTDISRLQMAVATLGQLQHLDIFKDLQGTFQKIQQSVQFKINTPSVSKAIYFEPVPFYKGTEHISVFLKAIETTRTVSFNYHSFKSSIAFEHGIHPYFLQEYSNRWYIIGLSKKYQKVTSFALERIVGEPQILKEYFDTPKDFSPKKYFENTFGMTHDYDTAIENIVLEFKPLQAKYFESKPFHAYTILNRADNGTLTVQLKLVVNYELIRKIVGMGREVKVLKPQSLIDAVIKNHDEALNQYK